MGPRGRSGRVWKIVPHMGFDPSTLQPVVTCYIDYTIPALDNILHRTVSITDSYSVSVLTYTFSD